MRSAALILFASLVISIFSADIERPSERELVMIASEELVEGKINEAIKNFEEAVRIKPSLKPHLWQLGIVFYYAERFEEGRKLFELHQTVNPNDVENAVWHFLCTAREKNVEAARENLIPITGDKRVPMKEIHALFSGKATKDEVVRAASKLENPGDRTNALCYAHLYLSLYEEAHRKPREAFEHAKKAAEEYHQDRYLGYMGRIVKLHAKLRTPRP